MKSLKTIIAIAAVTIDGKIARHADHLTDWTSPEDKIFLRAFLDKSDVVVVGHNTYKTAEGPLSKRNCIVLTRTVQNIERQSDRLLFWNPEGTPIETVLEPYRIIALLGGAQAYTYFLEHDLIDELYLTIEPLAFGRGLNLFESGVDIETKFQLVSIERLNEKGAVLLYYKKLLP
jgi:dihydrofolate reductase